MSAVSAAVGESRRKANIVVQEDEKFGPKADLRTNKKVLRYGFGFFSSIQRLKREWRILGETGIYIYNNNDF